MSDFLDRVQNQVESPSGVSHGVTLVEMDGKPLAISPSISLVADGRGASDTDCSGLATLAIHLQCGLLLLLLPARAPTSQITTFGTTLFH